MLIQLSSEQSAEHWEYIKYGIESALLPTVGLHEERMSNVLESIMLGKMVVWLSVSKGTREIEGLVVTALQTDELSTTKSMLIYAVYGINSAQSSWPEGLRQLTDYAKSEECHKILAYSNVPEIINYIKSIGGNTDLRLLILPM